jgi:hypothetical protein
VPHSPSGHSGEEITLFPLQGIETFIVQPIA